MLPMPKLPPCREDGDRIAFFGPMVSGKTYCANTLVNTYGEGYRKVAFADKLKLIASELYGVTGKDGYDRTLLQALGADLRKHDPEVWIKYLLQTCAALYEESWGSAKFVLDDLRYVNEATALRENGFMIILVSVPEEERKRRLTRLYPETPLSAYYHESERQWEAITYDAVIDSSESAAPVLDQIKAARRLFRLTHSTTRKTANKGGG